MGLDRLDTVAAVAAERFRRASSSKRREAVRIACQHAISAVGIAEEEVGRALAILHGTAAPDASVVGRIENLVSKFDDQYFLLDDGGDAIQKEEALRLFSKARAASALAFALSSEDAQLHEAIYEAISALDNPDDLVRLVEEVLR